MANSPWLLVLAAYLAAGTFFVLRDLKLGTIDPWELMGLAAIVLLWLPITLVNVIALLRTEGLGSASNKFAIETAPPLLLCIALVMAATA